MVKVDREGKKSTLTKLIKRILYDHRGNNTIRTYDYGL